MNHDIFISYSSKQKSIADGVCHYLEENGFKCWMAPRDILVGSDYGDLIEDAIKTCKVVVLVFSQSASISKWVKGEINVAFTEDKPILPFRVDETEIKGGFRVMLNQMHWIDAFPQYADRLPDLLNSVCGFLGRQPQKVSDERERLETDRKAKEAEERERQEKERLAKEAARLKAELEREEQERLARERAEAERKAKEEAERERLEREQKTKQTNGHEYVDLGLPSGTLWATCNVGANKPEDFGDYFSWGDVGKTAAANWGNGWCIPSKEQWEELMQNTKSIWTTRNDVNGRLFIANNGNSLFLPAAGIRILGLYKLGGVRGTYLSSSLIMEKLAWVFSFDSDNYYITNLSGNSVRAVREN